MTELSKLLIVYILICGCQSEQKKAADHSHHNHDMHKHMDMESSEPTSMSIYNMDSEWRSQANEKLTLGKLRGKVVVMAMVYTHCEFACPRIVADMQRIES